jgi:hypothetical protein
MLRYPTQAGYLGKRVIVCQNRDTSETFEGVIVRDDAIFPFFTIIRIETGPDVGKYLMSTECQYRLKD